MAIDTEITKVRIVIRHLLWQIREVRKDRDAAWKWVNRFANTLQYQDLEQDPDQYALAILAEARSFNDLQQRKQQMRWVRAQLAKEGVTSPTQEQLDEKWLEMYGNAEEEETTADGDIREDSQDVHDGSNSGMLESGTSANLYGDAPHREAEDESATVSRNMRRVPQNEAPAHGFSGGRTAQGTMSPSPSGAAQDGKFRGSAKTQGESNTGSTVPAVCPESGDISKARQSQARESQRRTGAPVRGATSSTAPVRSYRPRKIPHPKGEYEVFDFASENGIPEWVANEFYQRFFVERDGTDTDGNNIDNWKGALINYSKSRKRETA